MTQTTYLSQSATAQFSLWMNPIVTTEVFGQTITSATLFITPEGVLPTPIRVIDGGYIVDLNGRHKSQQVIFRGYHEVSLTYAGHRYVNTGVHRLVAYGFKQLWSSRANQTSIHHVDQNPHNNHANNLMLLTNSANVLRYFSGADNKEWIDNQEYLTERLNSGDVPLMFKGEVIEGYTINAQGQVFHKNKKGEYVRVNPRRASKKYENNMIVTVNQVSTSLHNLMAQNFLVTPQGKYKTLMKDAEIDNPWQARNLYSVPVKHSNAKAGK